MDGEKALFQGHVGRCRTRDIPSQVTHAERPNLLVKGLNFKHLRDRVHHLVASANFR